MYHNFLPAMQFVYLDEIGVCWTPVPRMSPTSFIPLISFLDFVANAVGFFSLQAMSIAAVTLHSSVAALTHTVGGSVRHGMLTSHSRNRLGLDSSILGVAYYSLYRISMRSRITQPSRLVRLLARDGEESGSVHPCPYSDRSSSFFILDRKYSQRIIWGISSI